MLSLTIGALSYHSFWNYFFAAVYGLSLSGGEATQSILKFTVKESMTLFNGGVYGMETSIVTTITLKISLIILINTVYRSKIKVYSEVTNY